MIQLTVEKVLNATNNILSKQIFQKNEVWADCYFFWKRILKKSLTKLKKNKKKNKYPFSRLSQEIEGSIF